MAGGVLLVLAFLYLFLLLQGVTLVSAGGNPQTAPEDIHLLKFKGNILFDPFHALIDWTSSNPLCNWTGVECDNYNHVLRLDLQNKLLRGSIAPDIASLEHLKYLNLENNSFIGQIPGGLGALSNLLELRLGLNPLSGSIPDDIWSMRGIGYIDISGTNISGGLSPSIRSLTNISYLYLNHNKLGGAIPSEMGTLQSLQKLYINGNGFSGEFPVEIMGLPILSTLDISNNNFSGVVPAGRSGLTFRFSNNAHLSACTNRNIRGLRDIPTPAPIANQKAGSYPSYLASAAIIGVLSAAVFILLLGGLLFYYRIFKQRKHITNNSKFTENDEEHAWTIYTRRFTFDHLRRATKNFSRDSIIGSGGFGLVYKARLDTGEIVAIKRSIQESYQGHNEFHNEVKLLSKVHHKHLVNLVGFCEESGEQMLVYEYAPNGSLLDHIVGENGMLLTWTQRVQIAIDSAKGIAYLHEGCSPAIIHRDIKPSNILLGYDFEAKVSDFGLSKLGPDGNASHVSTQVKGTPGYLDPHYYLSFHLSTFSDVYSFGVIMLQLVTARPAVDHSRKRSQYHVINWVRNSVERGCLEDIMDPRLMSQPYNREVLLEMSKIGLRCTSKDMKGRPTMSMVGQELEMAVWINRKPMVLQWSMSPEELGVRRKRGDELLRQNLFGDAYALPKKQHLDASYEQHHDASYALPKKQHLDASYEQHHDADLGAKYIEGQRSMDNSGINKSMEVGYHWNQEESLSSEKSLDWSQAGLETFHMDLEGLSTINVRCLDSNDEWEDQNSISSDNHRRKT